MTRLKLFVTVGCLALPTASPALAQHMIDDAGTFPFSMGNPFVSTDLPPNTTTSTVPPDPRLQSHAMMKRHARQRK